MAKIEDIEGIGPAHAEKLKGAGVSTVEDMLFHGATRAQREDLAAKTGIEYSRILEWVNRADLFRVKGVGSEYADLLEAAGVDSVPELAQRNAENLLAALSKVNAEKSLVRQLPTLADVTAWIADAKDRKAVVTH